MDLGITGRQAVVCAASSGLGFACAAALVSEGALLMEWSPPISCATVGR